VAMRTCVTCKAAENPLGRLKFRKFHGIVYCENCSPGVVMTPPEPTSAPILPSPLSGTSAGSFVVIPCPQCRSVPRGRVPASCDTCSDYGSVRIPVNFLNVYRPKPGSEPKVLLED